MAAQVGVITCTVNPSPTDANVSDGIRFHLMDIYLEELRRVIPSEEWGTAPMGALMRPFETLAKGTRRKEMRQQIQDEILRDPQVLAVFESPLIRAKEDSSPANDASADDSDDSESAEVESWQGFDELDQESIPALVPITRSRKPKTSTRKRKG